MGSVHYNCGRDPGRKVGVAAGDDDGEINVSKCRQATGAGHHLVLCAAASTPGLVSDAHIRTRQRGPSSDTFTHARSLSSSASLPDLLLASVCLPDRFSAQPRVFTLGLPATVQPSKNGKHGLHLAISNLGQSTIRLLQLSPPGLVCHFPARLHRLLDRTARRTQKAAVTRPFISPFRDIAPSSLWPPSSTSVSSTNRSA